MDIVRSLPEGSGCRNLISVRGACLLAVLLLCGWNLLGAQTTTSRATPSPDPKLSTLLESLRESVPQQTRAALAEDRVAESSALQAKPLPKSIGDAVAAKILKISGDAEVQVYLELSDIQPSYIEQLQALGVRIERQADPASRRSTTRQFSITPMLQAEVPLEQIQQVEDLPFVQFIRTPDYAMSSASGPGSVVTQGDHILQADLTRTQYGVNGSGVSIGVISSGIGGIFANGCNTNCGAAGTVPSPITLGDLPSATGIRTNGVLTSVSGGITAARSYRADLDLEDVADGSGGAEGTAMLEILYDMAPKATLSFANADTSLDFEAAVNAMAQTNQVVVDDMFFVGPSYDGMSAVSQNTADALNNLANPIRAYITSGGNLALDHYSATYSASPVDGLPYTNQSGFLHLFTGSAPPSSSQPGALVPPVVDAQQLGNLPFDPLISLAPGQSITVALSWNDHVGSSSNNYDLFLLALSCTSSADTLPTKSSTCALMPGNPFAKSTTVQGGTQDPYEIATYTNPTTATTAVNLGVAIQNVGNTASPSAVFDMFVIGQGAKQNSPNHNFYSVAGSVPEQSDAGGGVISVGAVNQSQCLSPDNCTGPVEAFSSQGPTQMTPQNSSPTVKPNMVAVDQVCITGAGGFGNPIPSSVSCGTTTYTPKLFGGTSAAAPHVAAIAALTLQMAPCLAVNNDPLSPSAARTVLSSALTGGTSPLGAYLGSATSLPNDLEGYGLIDAYSSAGGLLPYPAVLAAGPATGYNATSNTGVLVPLVASLATTNSHNPSQCMPQAIEWSGGDCVAGTSNSTTGQAQCAVGIDPVSVALSLNGVSFLPAAQATPVNIVVNDFTLSAAAYSNTSTSAPTNTVTVTRGSPALYVVTIASAPSLMGDYFTGSVSFSCSNLPPGLVCQFASPSLTPSGTSAMSSVLTIYTSGLASLETDKSNQHLEHASVLPFFALPLCLAILIRRKRTLWNAMMVGVCCVFLISLTSCSSSTSAPTTAGTYTITINGTYAQLTHSATVNLIVE